MRLKTFSKSSLSLIILIVISLTFSVPNAFAEVKAGGTCKKLGQIQVVKKQTYACVKSGKKLIWRKKAEVVKPTTNLPEKVPTLSFIETLRSPAINGKFPIENWKFAIPNDAPTSWQDLYEKRAGIAYQAWLSISKTDKKTSSVVDEVTIAVGPKTKLLYGDIEGAIAKVSRSFFSTAQPKTVRVLAFNYDDRDWALAQVSAMVADEEESYRKRQQDNLVNTCSAERQVCWGATAGSTPSGKGFLLVGIVDKDGLQTLDPSFSSYMRSQRGLTIAHEYFHVIQLFTLGKNWYQMMYTPPTWFNEASATFVENAVMNQSSFDTYMRFRASDSHLAYPSCGSVDQGCIAVTEEVMTKFLSLSNYQNNWSDFPYGMKYEVSNRVIEALVALKSYQSIADIYRYQAQNHTFEEAFEHVYGIEYSKAIPILAKIVSEEFANNL